MSVPTRSITPVPFDDVARLPDDGVNFTSCPGNENYKQPVQSRSWWFSGLIVSETNTGK
jgi:hypothetical protein